MAVTATVTSTIITITSTGGVGESFANCVTAVNTVTPGTITGLGTSASPYVITTPSGYRRFTFNSGTIVTMAADTYVSWGNITATGNYAFFINSGAVFNIAEGCYINQSAGTAGINVYNYTTGAWNVTGTALKRVTFKGMTRFYMYGYQACTWTYFDIVDQRASGASGLYFTQITPYAPVMSFTNFTVTAPVTGFGYAAQFSAGGMYTNVTMSDFVIDGIQTAFLITGCSARIANGTIKNCLDAAVAVQGGGNVISPSYETAQDDTIFPTGRNQSMAVIENVDFIDNSINLSTGYNITNVYNSLLQVKDCTFTNVTYAGTRRGIYSYYSSCVLEYNNTFTNLAINKVWATNGTFLHCRKIDILVEDLAHNPITDATVSFVQGSNPSKERWAFLTNSSGIVVNVFGCSIMLVEKEETALGTYAQWSNDDTAGLCHYLLVAKTGYVTQTATYEMTEDKNITITLLIQDMNTVLPGKPFVSKYRSDPKSVGINRIINISKNNQEQKTCYNNTK
jgi:hypothetical protein